MLNCRAMPFCPNCGKENEAYALFCQTCGVSLKPDGAAQAAAPAVQKYGGFWIRVVATIIDWIIVSAGTGIIVAVSFGGAFPIVFVADWLYSAFMTSSEWQATIGKKVFNLAVTDIRGQRISFARATGRHFAKWISALLLFIGYIMVAFTERKQGLHDLIAETLVVDRSAR